LAGTPELDGAAGDLAGLHLTAEADEREREKFKERAVNRVKVEELVAKVKKDEEESGKKGISLIVVGEYSDSFP
jgi:elongation factor 1 alpha-like protein